MGFTGTPAAEYTETAVLDRYDEMVLGIGQYNRRPIAGTSRWSEHSWGNALDIHVRAGRTPVSLTAKSRQEKANGDEINAWLNEHREELGIRVLLWWVRSHYDHIHVDFWPRGYGTPPLRTTGIGQFEYSDDRIETAQIQKNPDGRTRIGGPEVGVTYRGVEEVPEDTNNPGQPRGWAKSEIDYGIDVSKIINESVSGNNWEKIEPHDGRLWTMINRAHRTVMEEIE